MTSVPAFVEARRSIRAFRPEPVDPDVVAAATGYDGPPQLQPARPGELRRSAPDASAAGTQLGWRPWTSLEDGVSRTVEWFRAQGRHR